jgi:hypothetical protein
MRVGVSDSSRSGDTPREYRIDGDSFSLELSSVVVVCASFFFGFCGQKESKTGEREFGKQK